MSFPFFFNRDVLGNISASSPISYAALEPILPQLTVGRLEEDCINIVRVRHYVCMCGPLNNLKAKKP